MKKLYFIIVLLLFGIQKIFPQNYTEMLTNDVEWQLTNCSNGCLTDVYFTDGDTIYNGSSYSILNGYHFISKTFWLRENIQNQKVYMSFIHNNLRREVLLYDFDMQKGDSINISNPISPFISNPGYYVVDSVVVLQLQNGLYYEHFYLSSLNLTINESAVWIEGIGSLSLINAPGGTPNVNGAGKLSCFFNNGNLVYSQLDSITSCVFSNPIITSNISNVIYNNRKLISIKNLMGKEITLKNNTPLFYIYDDGTVEKKLIIE